MQQENIQLWDAAALRQNIWPEHCRPSLRWVRQQTKARAIPSIRMGRLIFYNPDQVRAHLEKRSTNTGAAAQ